VVCYFIVETSGENIKSPCRVNETGGKNFGVLEYLM